MGLGRAIRDDTRSAISSPLKVRDRGVGANCPPHRGHETPRRLVPAGNIAAIDQMRIAMRGLAFAKNSDLADDVSGRHIQVRGARKDVPMSTDDA